VNSNAYVTSINPRDNTDFDVNGFSHATTFSYNYTTGNVSTATDPNLQTTTYQYSDPLNRLTEVSYPDGGETDYCYTDVGGSLSGASCSSGSSFQVYTGTKTGSGSYIQSYTTYDGLGRATQTALTSAPGGPIYTDTIYDGEGQVQIVSNPYQGTPTGFGISYAYDAVGRKISQAQQDGSTLSWCYDNQPNSALSACPNSSSLTNVSWITSQDEAGHITQHLSDGLGRLVGVMEQQPSGTNLALETDYTYNALDDLVYVNQKGTTGDTARTRSFAYDTLSQLIGAQNPETGNGLTCAGAPSGTTWGICYSYDPNGNLKQKTDARSDSAYYSYDALNRKLTEQGAGINYAYVYDVLPGAPAGSANIGRLVSASNSSNAEELFSYDSMGRLNWQSSWTPQSPNNTGIVMFANYDFTGHMTSFTYPDGRVVSQTFDGAAHLTNANYASWKGNTINQPYFTATDPTDYDPMGHLVGGTIGAGLPYNAAYDNRGRIQSLGYGPTATPLWSKQYGWLPNSNLQTITDQVSGVQRQFAYDKLDRLTSAQDIFASWSSGGSNPGNCATGSSAGTGSSSGTGPQWTDPDDSNSLLNPDDPGSTGWVNINATLTPSTFAAPDGTMSATTLTANAGSPDSIIAVPVVSPVSFSSTTVVASIWVRATSGTQTLNLYLSGNWNGGSGIPGWKQVQLTTSWQQVQVTGTTENNLTSLYLQIGGGGSISSGQSFAFWNPMLEDAGSAAPSVTNFLPYSQRTLAGTWTYTTSPSDNAATAPDGSNTAASLTAPSGSSDAVIEDYVQNPAPFSGLAVTGSIWLKAPSGSQQVYLTLIEGQGSGVQTLSSQTVTVTSRWQRFQVTGTTTSSLDLLALHIGGYQSITNGEAINLWGAQMELASTAGPYAATAAKPVTIGTGLTNILPNSQNLNGSSWALVNGTAAVNSDVAPDGTQTAATITDTASGTTLANYVANPSLYDGQTITTSVYLRSTSGPQTITMLLVDHDGNGLHYPAQTTAQVTSSWQRFSFTSDLSTGLDTINLQIGTGTSVQTGLEVWGAQMEVAPSAGPYVATGALPVLAGKEFVNILPNSQNLSGPSWVVVNGTAAINSDTSPDGTQTAATITDTGAGTFLVDNVMNPSLYDGQTVTASVYLRSTSGPQTLTMLLVDHNENGWEYPGAATAQVTSGWQRFSVTGTLYNGVDNINLQIGTGNSVQTGLEVWGAQMVPGTDPAPYIPTTCSTTNYVSSQPGTLVPNGLNESYSYDSFGNILQNGGFNSSYNANNQMNGYAYDAAGNLLSDGLFNQYTWDAEGQLTSNGSATYIYDAEGQRVEKQGVAVTDTIYFGGRPVARLSAGQWTDLIYGPAGMLAEVPGTQTGAPSFRMLDHLGNEVGTLGSNGQLVNPLDYTPFGQIFSGSTDDPYLFTGKERDTESGNDYFGARYFTSNIGHWISPDWSAKVEPVPYSKLDDPQTLNLYSYVRNNPVSQVDLDGHYFVVSEKIQQQVQQYISTMLRTPQGAATINAIASSSVPVSFGLGTLRSTKNADGTTSITAGITVPVPGNATGSIGGANVTLDNSNISTIANATGESDFKAGLTAFAHEDQHVTDILSASSFIGAAAANAAGDAPSEPGADNTTGGTAERRAEQIVDALGRAGNNFHPDAAYDAAAAAILKQGAAQQQTSQQESPTHSCATTGGAVCQ
jgi:RHS repeat-associated protein